MKKLYLSAPLPFVGQKRMFARNFIEIISRYPEGTVFVDLFGGSGLLSHIAKHHHPGSHVIYNDYDGYSRRIGNIPRTNMLLSRIRTLIADSPRNKPIPGEIKTAIIDLIGREERETGFVDYITLSSSLLFSMKYRTSLETLSRETFYNCRQKNTFLHIMLVYQNGSLIVSVR